MLYQTNNDLEARLYAIAAECLTPIYRGPHEAHLMEQAADRIVAALKGAALNTFEHTAPLDWLYQMIQEKPQ